MLVVGQNNLFEYIGTAPEHTHWNAVWRQTQIKFLKHFCRKIFAKRNLVHAPERRGAELRKARRQRASCEQGHAGHFFPDWVSFTHQMVFSLVFSLVATRY